MQLDWTDQIKICFYLEYSCNLIIKDLFCIQNPFCSKIPLVWMGMMLVILTFLEALHTLAQLHQWITQKRVILVHSFILYLHLIHPSASFFPKHCVSDTCNILVAGVSARDLLLDLSLLTLSTTCPLFLWGFYYKTAIAPLISTRHKFNPHSPDHCGPFGVETHMKI